MNIHLEGKIDLLALETNVEDGGWAFIYRQRRKKRKEEKWAIIIVTTENMKVKLCQIE